MAVRSSIPRRRSLSTAPWTFDVALAVLATAFLSLASIHIRPSVQDAWGPASRFFPGLLLEAFAAGGNANVTAARALTTLVVYVIIAAALTATVFARRDVTA